LADGESGNMRSLLIFFQILLGIIREVKIATLCFDCSSVPFSCDKGLISAIGGPAV